MPERDPADARAARATVAPAVPAPTEDLPSAAAAGWAAALPICAALAGAIPALVPPLTRALTHVPGPGEAVVSALAALAVPTPGDFALYTVCLAVPALAAWALSVALARSAAARRLPLEPLALGAQALAAVAVAGSVLYQDLRVHRLMEPWRWGLGIAVTCLALWAWRRAGARRDRDLLPARLGAASVPLAFAIALVATAALLSTAVFDGVRVMTMPATVGLHLPFTLSEFAAVLDGRTAWVDYFPLYVTVLPYLLAPAFRLTGLDVLAFSRAMAALSLVGLVLQYDLLRRVTRRPWVALALYLAFAGFSFFPSEVLRNGTAASAFSYFAHAPLRYFFPWVVGWLVAWYLERPTAARRLSALGVAALGVLNNLDFGLPAFGGAFAAILLTGPGTVLPRARHAARVLGAAAGAVAAATVALELVTLARTGRLVSPAALTAIARVYAVVGFNMLAMPRWGIHWVLYGTCMAGLVAALVRLALLRARERDSTAPDAAGGERLLSGVLLFASAFGAGALAIFVGRSHFAVLIGCFPAWALVLVLLCWLGLRPGPGPRAPPSRRLSRIPAALAIAGLGWCVGEALPLPRPEQNLYAEYPANPGAAAAWFVAAAPALAARVRAVAAPGEQVMITTPGGHLVSELAGVDDVFPFQELEACVTWGQVLDVADRAEAARVTKVFGPLWPELRAELARRRLPIAEYALPDPPAAPWPR